MRMKTKMEMETEVSMGGREKARAEEELLCCVIRVQDLLSQA